MNTTTIQTEEQMGKVSSADLEIMIKLYNEGNSPYEISRLMGNQVTHTAVRKRLIEAGVKMRGLSEAQQNRNVPDLKILKRLYVDEGKSTYAIGKEFDVSPATIWVRLNNAGVPMRDFDTAKERQKQRRA